jgi:hypothetical protein
MKEIAQAFDIHYANVSRFLKKMLKSMIARPDPSDPRGAAALVTGAMADVAVRQ